MLAFKKSFFEYESLPAQPKPCTVYYINENGIAQCYVTDTQGVAYPQANTAVIIDVINSLGLGGGGRPFRETYKDQILLGR